MKFPFYFSFTLFFFVLIVNSSAQDSLKHCGTEGTTKFVLLNNPNAIQLNKQLENFTKQFQQNGNTRQQYVIPIVFHIIHNNGLENISDWQVKDAVRILNEDFNLQNADTTEILSAFIPIAANCGFEFRLATIDPIGNCTNGINHIESLTTYSGGEQSKLNGWPNDKYLNVWVVKEIASGAAGYTYLPGNAWADSDGILILSSYLGSIGTGAYHRARVLTHEIGHWINLLHVWGGTNSPGISCGDDNVNDTPITMGWTNCNLNAAICSGALENVQNYMDYAYCDRMFTNGQKARMIAALNSSVSGRNNLWTSANLIATGTNSSGALNVCSPIPDFITSTKYVCVGQPFSLIDKSTNAIVLYRNWSLPGAASASSLTDSIITVTYNIPGFYIVTLLAGNNSGSNSISKQAIQVMSETAIHSGGFIEGFEAGEFPTNNFIPDSTMNIDWQISNIAAYTGSRCIALNNLSAYTGKVYGITGPTFNMTTFTNPILTFHVAYSQIETSNTDKLRVYVSENCGKTWILRYAKTGIQLATTTPHFLNFVPTNSEWRMETVNLGLNDTSTNLRIRFDLLSGGGNNIYIDDINMGSYSFINNLISENVLQLYPNPVSDELNLLFNNDYEITGYIKLMDLTGRMIKEIYSGTMNSGYNLNIDVSTLSPQVYIIQLERDGKKQNFRFVKI